MKTDADHARELLAIEDRVRNAHRTLDNTVRMPGATEEAIAEAGIQYAEALHNRTALVGLLVATAVPAEQREQPLLKEVGSTPPTSPVTPPQVPVPEERTAPVIPDPEMVEPVEAEVFDPEQGDNPDPAPPPAA